MERETTQENVAHEIGIDRTTFYRKMKNGSFTVKEAKMIANVLPLSKDEAIEIFFN
ncbi:XRE family transcriptional regulator [Ligilactobacillus salivarius]|uniref:XRE family transcriptional regulator n=1 Tax=Ligilactobacillus salivarius TaxID=1624 RepID=UPI002988016B|nr:XRE family transcriptional regulator [Ligilactobacillus salivarius]